MLFARCSHLDKKNILLLPIPIRNIYVECFMFLICERHSSCCQPILPTDWHSSST